MLHISTRGMLHVQSKLLYDSDEVTFFSPQFFFLIYKGLIAVLYQ